MTKEVLLELKDHAVTRTIFRELVPTKLCESPYLGFYFDECRSVSHHQKSKIICSANSLIIIVKSVMIVIRELTKKERKRIIIIIKKTKKIKKN